MRREGRKWPRGAEVVSGRILDCLAHLWHSRQSLSATRIDHFNCAYSRLEQTVMPLPMLHDPSKVIVEYITLLVLVQ